jgi:hypothetical protein
VLAIFYHILWRRDKKIDLLEVSLAHMWLAMAFKGARFPPGTVEHRHSRFMGFAKIIEISRPGPPRNDDERFIALAGVVIEAARGS